MAEACSLEVDATGVARLSGALTFRSVPDLHREQASRFDGAESVSTLDLSGVDSVDSAGLALLLEWQAHRPEREGRLRVLNAPGSLISLARLCEADSVLDLSGRGEGE